MMCWCNSYATSFL